MPHAKLHYYNTVSIVPLVHPLLYCTQQIVKLF